MKKTVKGLLFTLVLTVMLVCVSVFSVSAANSDDKWISAWGTAPTEIGIEGYDNIAAYIGNVTSRTVITPTASGSKLRIRVSNYYGDDVMKLTRVTVAKSLGGSKIDPDSVKIVTFNEGQPFVSVPAGKEYMSDPVTFDVKAGEDIAISIYIEDFTEIKTMGLSGGDTYLAVGDDYSTSASMDIGTMVDNEEIMKYLSLITGSDVDLQLAFSFVKVVPCLASMDVLSDEKAYSVVVVGDSTVSNEFPLYLSQEIQKKGFTNVGVVGKGLMGNRLLGDGLGYGSLIFGESLLDRFQRDVLSQAGLEYVVVKIGANDIMHPVCTDIAEQYPDIEQPTWQEICLGYRKLFQMCHNAGVKVIVIGITPWKGATRDYLGTGAKYVRTDEEFKADWQIALNVNKWLSTTLEHDGYIDFNPISVNPKDTAAFFPEYTIDGIHPSDTMQKIWGEKFPQSLIGVGKDVAGVRLNKTSAAAYIGTVGALKADIYPSTAQNKNLIWKSSNSSVVKVNSKGVVECVGVGVAVISCITEDGGYTASCKITVYAKPTSIKLSKTSGTMYTTKSGQLTATVLPANAYDKSVVWSSSNTKVATVDQTGKVVAVGSGTAVITVKTKVGGVTAKCTVKVIPKVEVTYIALNVVNGSMYKGATYQLTNLVYPANATYQQVQWSSSNSKIVSVTSTGLIKGLAAGKATIYCRSVDNPRVVATCNINVVVKTTGVKLSHTSGSVYAGYTGQLKYTIYPADATNKNVKWSSSDTSVATVDSNGKIKGIKPGKAVITCTTVNGGFKASCTITVKPVIKPTSVTLNKTGGSMYVGSYYQLTATVKPDNATNKKVTWTSSNTSVLKVSANGKIYGVKAGKAVITCKTADSGKTATCTVTVKPVIPTSVVLNTKGGTMAYGKSYQLKATVYPANATDKRVTWSSSNPKAVSVSSTGVIKALTPNSSAVITCTTVSGGRKVTCTVKVAPIAVTGIKLNMSSGQMKVGGKGTLVAAVQPSNATNKAVVWSSSDTSIITVTQNGVVTAKARGTATISCKTKDGGFVAKCVIKVLDTPVLGIMLDKSQISGKVGSVHNLTATVVPENATNKNVKWTTTDSKVAVVNAKGQVVCIGKGSCQIWASSVDGNYIASCKVIVS